MTEVVDALGRTTLLRYDDLDRLTETENALGGISAWQYDATGNVLAFVDALGRTTSYEYDDLDRQTATVDALGGRSSFGYDEVGNLTEFVNARGATTTFEYDDLDRQTAVVDALGGRWESAYDAVSNLTRSTDALGRESLYRYDDLDRLVEAEDPLGGISAWQYDAVGNTTAFVDALGRTTAFEYDLLDRQTAVVDALGGRSTYGYDEVGNLTEFVNARGATTTYEYDLLDRQTAVVDALGGRWENAYDAVGNLTLSTDALGRESRYRYDDLDRLVETEDALGAVVGREYDAVGNLTAYVDPLGNRTNYVYDDLDRVVEEIDPLSHARTYAYDAVGNLTEYIDRNGRSTVYEYDLLDRLTDERWRTAGGAEVNHLEFDRDAVGNLLAATDAYSRYSYTYDNLDRVVTEDNAGSPGMPHVVLTHTYDAVGNRVNVADNLGVNVASVYTARDQPASRTWTGLPGGAEAAIEFEYDLEGMRTAVARFADAGRTQLVGSTVFDYDDLSRLVDLTHRNAADDILARYEYGRNAVDEIVSGTHHGETTDYVYDATGQLVSADATGQPDESYTYDANGNRISGPTVVGPGNRLLSDDQFDYAYDAEGNLTTKTDRATGAVTAFTYDHRNRLTHVEVRSAGGIILSVASFTYDVFDRRIAETVDPDGAGAQAPRTTRFVYDGENVWADFDATDDVAARYLFGDDSDELLARWRAGENIAWYLTDHLGTVRDIVDHTGGLINTIAYDSFGRVLAETNAAAGDRYKFTGREYVASLGLYYYRARFYDPINGRFLSTDPLSFAAGDANLYRYVGNRPLTFTDPSGMTLVTEYTWSIRGTIAGISGVVGMVCGAADAAFDNDPTTDPVWSGAFGFIIGGGLALYGTFQAIHTGLAAVLVTAGGASIASAAYSGNTLLASSRSICMVAGIAVAKFTGVLGRPSAPGAPPAPGVPPGATPSAGPPPAAGGCGCAPPPGKVCGPGGIGNIAKPQGSRGTAPNGAGGKSSSPAGTTKAERQALVS